jgi:cobalt-zinc-cadmium efflux system membrane fusion protein
MNRMKTTIKTFFKISFLCTVILMSCSKDDKSNTVSAKPAETENEDIVLLTSAQIKIAGIEMGKIEQKELSGTIKVNGVLDVPPQQLISVSAPMGGFVKNTTLLQGSPVKKGQVIATIENLDFIQMQQDYVEAKSHYELSKADYDRQLELAKENVNSQKAIQQSKSNFQTWQAKYNGLREKLKVLNIDVNQIEEGHPVSTINLYSPINGYVTEVHVNLGKFVNPTDVLFEIVDTQHLHAELTVFEKDLPKLKIGQKVRFTLANESTERFATIHLIGREISPERTVRIHCHIDTEDPEMLPGMYLSALVETGGAKVSALPNEAIVDYLGKKYIFVSGKAGETSSENREFRMVGISAGISDLGYTEVSVSDSLANADVVVKAAYAILSKMKNSEETTSVE